MMSEDDGHFTLPALRKHLLQPGALFHISLRTFYILVKVAVQAYEPHIADPFAKAVSPDIPVPLAQVHAAVSPAHVVIAWKTELTDPGIDGRRDTEEFAPLQAVGVIVDDIARIDDCIRECRINSLNRLGKGAGFINKVGIGSIESELRVGNLIKYNGLFVAAGG